MPGSNNVEVDPVTGVLKRDGAKSKMNPYDLYAVELALSLTEAYGGSVEVITIGPPWARTIIEEAVCMGAKCGTVLADRRFAGADVLATAYILLTFDGNTDEGIDADIKTVADLCLGIGALDVYIVDKKAVWSARGAFLEAIKASTTEMDECDVVVPVNKVDEFIKFTHSLAADMGIRIPSFGNAGDGNLHVYI